MTATLRNSILILIAISFGCLLQAQDKPLPVTIAIRNAFNNRSYVLQITNTSTSPMNLWIEAKGLRSTFVLGAGKKVNYGWAQGFHFDANNSFTIGSDGYSPITNIMPNVELSPMRLEHRKEGGFELSLSQTYVQDKAKDFNFPIKQSFSSVEIQINQVPQIELREGSDKMYAHCMIEASIAGTKIPTPLSATLSFIPKYIPETGELVGSQIQIEKADAGIFPQQYFDAGTNLINEFLPQVFSSYVLYTVPKSLLPFAKFFRVHDARVADGRLELMIF